MRGHFDPNLFEVLLIYIYLPSRRNFLMSYSYRTLDNGYNLKLPFSKSHILVGILLKYKYE